MNRRSSARRRGLKFSLTLHGLVLGLLVALPLLERFLAAKRPNEKLMFVEFTVSAPAPAAPEAPPAPVPEPPAPKPTDDIAVPEKKPDPPKSIKQNKRIDRKDFKAPPPKDKPPSEEEIRKLLARGARLGDKTRIPPTDQIALGAYYNHVHERMYAVWQQPGQLRNLPGLQTVVTITVNPDGRITARTKTRSSGNDLMDESVMKAVNSVKALRQLPAGHRSPVDITVTFELDS